MTTITTILNKIAERRAAEDADRARHEQLLESAVEAMMDEADSICASLLKLDLIVADIETSVVPVGEGVRSGGHVALSGVQQVRADMASKAAKYAQLFAVIDSLVSDEELEASIDEEEHAYCNCCKSDVALAALINTADNDVVWGLEGADSFHWAAGTGNDTFHGGDTGEAYDTDIYGTKTGGDRLFLDGDKQVSINFTSTENGVAKSPTPESGSSPRQRPFSSEMARRGRDDRQAGQRDRPARMFGASSGNPRAGA